MHIYKYIYIYEKECIYIYITSMYVDMYVNTHININTYECKNSPLDAGGG